MLELHVTIFIFKITLRLSLQKIKLVGNTTLNLNKQLVFITALSINKKRIKEKVHFTRTLSFFKVLFLNKMDMFDYLIKNRNLYTTTPIASTRKRHLAFSELWCFFSKVCFFSHAFVKNQLQQY